MQLVPRWDRVRAYDDPDAWVRRVALRFSHDPVFGYPIRATSRQGGPEGELLTTYEVRSYRPLPRPATTS